MIPARAASASRSAVRSGPLDTSRTARSRPRPRGLEWLRVVGPGVIVLGASIGSGEFLLGPAVFVRHGLSLLWVTAIAVVPADDLQHRADALHAGDRRAGVHRLHAHAPVVHAVGVGLRDAVLPADRLAGVGRQRGRRHLLSVRAAAARPGRRGRRSTSSASATFLACVGDALGRAADRAHARAAQLGAGRAASSAAFWCWR